MEDFYRLGGGGTTLPYILNLLALKMDSGFSWEDLALRGWMQMGTSWTVGVTRYGGGMATGSGSPQPTSNVAAIKYTFGYGCSGPGFSWVIGILLQPVWATATILPSSGTIGPATVSVSQDAVGSGKVYLNSLHLTTPIAPANDSIPYYRIFLLFIAFFINK